MERLHEIARAQSHLPSFDGFLRQVERAVNGSFPENNRFYSRPANPSEHYPVSPYAAVNVLLLSWEDDDLGVETEILTLQEVLQDNYRYSVDSWSIPSQKSHNRLGDRLRDFTTKYEREDSLLIVYYGGHGYLNAHRQLIWLCNQRENAATVRWFAHQVSLEELGCDVLILLDCCTAGGAGGEGQTGLKEVIAACGFETWAPGVGEHSFTKSLVAELRQSSLSRPFSAANLHQRVLERLKNWNPTFDPQGLSEIDNQGRLQDVERRKCPVHILLNNEPQYRSIVIAPLPADAMDVDVSDSAYSSDDAGYDRDSLGGLCAFQAQAALHPHTNAVIALQIDSAQNITIEDIMHEIQAMPSVAAAVELYSISYSHSILLLVAIPIAVWDLLPETPGCSFVGFSTSSNLLLGESGRQHISGLPMHTVDWEAVRLLLFPAKGSFSVDKNMRNALLWAAESGNVDVVNILLKSKDRVNVNAVDNDGKTALHRAAHAGYHEVVESLLRSGADVELRDSDDFNVLHTAVAAGREAVVRVVVKNGASLDAETQLGQTALHTAALKGHEGVVAILLGHGADARRKTKHGVTPLFLAAGNGHVGVVRQLLKKGIDIDAQNDHGDTALLRATYARHAEVVRLLLENNVDINKALFPERTALQLAVRSNDETIVQLLLEKMADKGDEITATASKALTFAVVHSVKETILQLLLKFGADVDAREHGGTALTIATKTGNESAMKLLLDHGADLNAVVYGDTALMIATRESNESAMKLLLDHGADVNAVRYDETALIIATRKSNESAIKLLLDHGADVNATSDGSSVLAVAKATQNSLVVQLLLDHGARERASPSRFSKEDSIGRETIVVQVKKAVQEEQAMQGKKVTQGKKATQGKGRK